MAPITRDRDLWIEAGGDPGKLDVLGRAGRVQPFSDGAARCLASIHPERPTIGAVGDWVGPPAVLREAEAWLAEQGCTDAWGPMLLCSWFPFRASLGPEEQPPMLMEPTEPASRWEAAGYEAAARYVSILSKHDPQIRAGMDRAGALSSRGWRIESAAALLETETPDRGALAEAMAVVHDLCDRAFADVDGYVHVPLDVVADWYAPSVGGLDPRLTLLARAPDGSPAGILLGLPVDVPGSEDDRRWFQILTLAVAPEHRHVGLATWLVAAAHQAARKAGYVAGVHAQVRVNGDTLEDTTWFRGELIRRYALYHRSLASG
jgi:GNAT superfamily N-acetyltransferase